MRRILDSLASLIDPARGGFRLAGFVFGMALPITLAAVVGAAYGGGLSDAPEPRDPVYIID